MSTGTVSSGELARWLIAEGARIDVKMAKPFQDEYRSLYNFVGSTPYLLAAKGGDPEMMQLFAGRGADAFVKNAKGTTALMAAAGLDMLNPNEDSGTIADGLACLRIALKQGADVNAANDEGDTALHGAAYRGSPEIVQILVDNGARLDVRNKAGWTPIQIANGDNAGLQNIQKRPSTVALMKKLMTDRGLPVEIKSDEEQYNFGVKVQ